MNICEEFITIQGEGSRIGSPSYFVRTTGCNLRCSWKNQDGTITKCDTPYTSFNPEKGKELDFKNMKTELEKTKINDIVLTGGEPMLSEDVVGFVEYFNEWMVTIETNGTQFINMSQMDLNSLSEESVLLSISPKMKNSYFQEDSAMKKIHKSGNTKLLESIRRAIKTRNMIYQLKFVVANKEDLKEIKSFVKDLDVSNDDVYLMPQGITNKNLKEVEKWLIDECIKEGYNFSPRLHINIWGNIRGI